MTMTPAHFQTCYRKRARHLLLLLMAGQSSAQTWCGKNYMRNQTIVAPGGHFPTPAVSITPLLAFRCVQSIRPFLPSDANSSEPSIIISAYSSSTEIASSFPFIPSTQMAQGNLSVVVTVDGQTLASGPVPLESTQFELPLLLSKLQPRKEAYTLQCHGSLDDGQTFDTTGKLTYLPEPSSGSVTKMDLRTGGLLAKSPTGEGDFAPVFPVGFYTQFDGYLTDLAAISVLKNQGFNVIHPIPPFPNLTALDAVLDDMERVGLYLMYDMRWTYQNDSQVTAEVNRIKDRKNLLLWYTANEPDGTSDPLNATVRSYNLINSLDGGDSAGGAGYHPVSLVLNCQDYEFSSYASGADIVMQDVYPIGNNVTFSSQWGTECIPDYGDCGCDNCEGSFKDISDRMDQFSERLTTNGWGRTKAVWAVPQGFGNVSYWKRYPTANEFMAQSILAINHGALGILSWMDPTSPEIKSLAASFAEVLPNITSYILNPKSKYYRVPLDNNVDIATWTLEGSGTLLLATNLNYSPVDVQFNLTQLGVATKVEANAPVVNLNTTWQAFNGGNTTFGWESDGPDTATKRSKLVAINMRFAAVGSTAFVFSSGALPTDGTVTNGAIATKIHASHLVYASNSLGLMVGLLLAFRV